MTSAPGFDAAPPGLTRMRLIATGLLVAMAALFLATGPLLPYHPAWGFVRAFAEAGMVGGMADWFAVTALFRHPLGLPIPHTPGGSVGAAVYPKDATDAGQLQRYADMALYRVKTQGGGRWSAFDETLRAESDRRLTLEDELRRAIPAGEIEPWFQPVIDTRSGRVVGVEVLARWRHPTQGLLSPAAFVPMAEELGLIGAVDEAVFAAGCATAAPWVSEGLIEIVSFNVSPRDLMDPGFSRKLIKRLAGTALPPTALTVEITETFLVRDLALSRRHIERLAAKGIRIALDDFGIGYSNLRALMHLPIQILKLDRSLICDVARDGRVAKLVTSMLQAARALGMRIVAEGVEDEAQAIFLRAAGCDRMQGYWFAMPMPAAELEATLRLSAPTVRVAAPTPVRRART